MIQLLNGFSGTIQLYMCQDSCGERAKIDWVETRLIEKNLGVVLNGRKGIWVYKKIIDDDFEAHLIP